MSNEKGMSEVRQCCDVNQSVVEEEGGLERRNEWYFVPAA